MEPVIFIVALVIGLMPWPMKRAYLFGLGCALIVALIFSTNIAVQSAHNRAIFDWAFYTALTSMVLSVVAFLAAKSAPPHRSRFHAIVGWLIGFFIIEVARFATVGIYLFVRFGF